MTINSSGTIHWTPSTTGEFRTKVTVRDAGGRATLHEFVLPVLSNAPPRIVSTAERSVVIGTNGSTMFRELTLTRAIRCRFPWFPGRMA